MRIVLLVILLGFPAVDIFVTVRFADWVGVPTWFWFVAGALAGWSLLRNERVTFRAKARAPLRWAQHDHHWPFDTSSPISRLPGRGR